MTGSAPSPRSGTAPPIDWWRRTGRSAICSGQAEAIALDGPLAGELRALAGGEEEDLRVSTLEAANTGLRAALIALHAAVETGNDAASRALNAAIWAELSASTRRRALANAPF